MLSSVTTWMNGEGIMLSEINQREKDKYHMISLIYKNLKKKKKKNHPNQTQKNRSDLWLLRQRQRQEELDEDGQKVQTS